MIWDDEKWKGLVGELVQMESPSGFSEGIEQVQERIVNELSGLDLQHRFHRTENGPILEIFREVEGKKGALLLGHADTVWPLGTLDQMPFREEGNRLYGPGVLDMKAGLVVGTAAVQDLTATTPFCWLITPDEETGSEASRRIIQKRARQASATFVFEPGGGDGSLKIGRSGVGAYRMAILGRESHAGLEPEQGASAIRELAQQILWLHSLENRVLGTTINVGVVEGGIRPNVVAGSAQALIDIRVRTQKERDRIEQLLSAPPQFDSRVRTEYHGSFSRPPMDHDSRAQVWFRLAAEIWERISGLALSGINVGGASDGNFTAKLSPTLDGLGAVGQGAHARHEHVVWDFMKWRYALVKELMEQAEEDEKDEDLRINWT
ncbi:MAG: M20 family metallopeptidase [Firmicutes bacterium]|nr:M20 family metallopeptidase [Bacillota bacterium]MCL5014140.1 M20 family metallopeptidase [Bacillota bacterium]